MSYRNSNSLSEEILKKINPPQDLSSFSEVANLLLDDRCTSVCLQSTFDFLADRFRYLVSTDVEGDLVLVGVWRGGLAVYLQALIQEAGENQRRLYLCDTFKGFLPIAEEHSKDRLMLQHLGNMLPAVATVDPRAILKRMEHFGLTTENVHVLEGDVAVTTKLFSRPISMLMVDVDFYEPTMAALQNLHPSVVVGGCVYVDDYGVDEFECSRAVDDFRSARDSVTALEKVNNFAVAWSVK